MVFFYFGPAPDSWALGNDKFSQCKNLPRPLQETWDSLAEAQGDPAKAGCEIEWLSTSLNGVSYAIMTKGGELLSNHNDVLAAADPASAVEYVSFAPDGGWLIRFTDGGVCHQNFPILADLAESTGQRQRSIVRSVFFGACNSRVVNTERGIFTDCVFDVVQRSLDRFGSYSDGQSPGALLGRGTALCPWDRGYHFVEEQCVKGRPSKYWHNVPSDQIPAEIIQSLVGDEDPPDVRLESPPTRVPVCGNETTHPPPAYQGMLSQPTASTVPGAVPAFPEELPSVYRLRDGSMAMAKPIICRSCKKGLAPGDPAYYCETCGESFCFCMGCHGLGSACPHKAPFVTFVQSSWLKEKRPTECARCWGSIKKGSVMWHCEKCFDPARCIKCWHKGKYCKHVELGKVSLYSVSKKGSSQTGEYIEGAVEVASAIFGF